MRGEFEFIRNLKSRYSLSKVGDDCAVLPKSGSTDLLLTADLLIEDIDFRLEWITGEQLGHKALAVSLSDIAAMGGDPEWSLLSLGIPQTLWKTDFVDRFYSGWNALAAEFGVELVGGDISRSPDKVVVDSVVGGSVAKDTAILRSGARPGDKLYVTGRLGAAAGGLKLLESGRFRDEKANVLLKAQLTPYPQLTVAKQLHKLGLPSAMIDVSDGLSSDAWHLAEASGFGLVINADRIPIEPQLLEFFDRETALDLALNGGEDFQLLFTSPADASEFGTHIGEVTEASDGLTLIHNGERITLSPDGFRHF